MATRNRNMSASGEESDSGNSSVSQEEDLPTIRKNLISEIEKERKKRILLKEQLNDIDFQLAQKKPLGLKTKADFVAAEKMDFDEFIPVDKEQEKVLKYLNKESMKTLGIYPRNISTPEPNKYLLALSTEQNICQFNIMIHSENLDRNTVKVIKALDIIEPKEVTRMDEFIDQCLNENDIPMIINGLTKYTDLFIKRKQIYKDLIKKYKSKIISRELQSQGLIDLLITTDKSKDSTIMIKWAIVYDESTFSFAYVFGIKSNTEKVNITSLKKENEKLFNEILDNKDDKDNSLLNNLDKFCKLCIKN